jgi:putative hemolysin
MEVNGYFLAASFLIYLVYLFITAAEHFLAISDSLILRQYLEGTRWNKISRVYDLENLQRLARTTAFIQITTFIGCPVMATAAFKLDGKTFQGLGIGTLAELFIYIYIGGYFLPHFLTKASNRRFIVFLLRFSARLYYLVRPLLLPADYITFIMRKSSLASENPDPGYRSESARKYIEHGKAKGFFESDEEELLHSVVEFGDTIAKEVMIPRVDMIYVPKNITFEEMVKTVEEHNHSRYPVYDKNIDDIVGIINIQDLFKYWGKENKIKTISELIREPYFVPESKKVDDLFREMQQRHIHMSIVVDEYGGTAGLVTLEDLLEEIVGEIQDEYETEEADIEKNPEGDIIALGKADIDELEEILGMKLSGEGFESIGGMILNELGKVPRKGDIIKVKGLNITVLEVEGRKIEKVKIRKIK